MSRKLPGRRNKSNRRSAFTLMEVLLVLAILVILGGMVGVMYQNVQVNAYKKAAKAQIDVFQKAVSLYQLSAQSYPSKLEDLKDNPGMEDATWGGPYIDNIPVDPWQNPYVFNAQGGGKPVISSNGPDGQANTGDDITG